MRLRLIRCSRGMTLVEMMVVSVILSVTVLGTLAIFVGSLNYWCTGVSASSADANAGLAVQKLVRDIEDASSASVQGGDLVVSFPTYNSTDRYYDRAVTSETITYYRSGANGTETAGTRENLWKIDDSSNKTLMMRGVSNISFSVDGGKIVTITLTGKAREGIPESSTTVTTKVRLRN